MKAYLFTKLTMRRLFILFLLCLLSCLIVTNAYFRNQMDEGLFLAYIVSISLVFIIPFGFKVYCIVCALIAQYQLSHSKEYPEGLLKQLSLITNKEYSSPITIIINDLYDLIKQISPNKKPKTVSIDKSLSKITIDGQAYVIDKVIDFNNEENVAKRLEITLLMNKSISIENVISKLNDKIEKEWEENEK